ncbi:MAG TPA: glycosyltransferase N-terminal domain-containing protein [bacterium]
MLRFSYFAVFGPLVVALAWLFSPAAPKLRRSFRERRGVWRRLEQALHKRDGDKPLVWFHVASAGEFLQAEPLLRRFRDAGWQLAVTVTSVSGQRWLQRIATWPELVWADLLPWDLWGVASRLYDRLEPRLVVYAQADIWPGLVWAGADRGIPQALIVGRLAATSKKLRRGLQGAYARDVYGALDLILAATDADRGQLARLVSPHADLRTGGDPGIETVLQRVREAQPALLPADFVDAPVIVCGSTWPADEVHLLPALANVLRALPAAKAVIAPHEPTEKRLAEIGSPFASFGVARLSIPQSSVRVILVDSVGKLAGLYRAGKAAYVGGAFSTGVHNVAEPAAAGLPVLFGPRHANSPVAADLVRQGIGLPVADAVAMEAALLGLLKDPQRCATLGAQGRSPIEARAGAAQFTFDALHALAPRR